MTEAKPLQPLTYGNVLIVGCKASNFDEEVKCNPRVILWDSQHQHWNSKELPVNTRAVFLSRWVGHSDFAHIVKEARKRRITIFNSLGTGAIARQVKELLTVTKVESKPAFKETNHVMITESTSEPTTTIITQSEEKTRGKLTQFIPLIDFDKTNRENAKILMPKAQELGIKTTMQSLVTLVYNARNKQAKANDRAREDVVVEMLDNMIKELRDMREFLVATTKENKALKQRIEKFRKSLDD
jgi:hypothetical protein